MFVTISKIIHDCLTAKDGETYDPARVYLAGGVLTFIGLTIYTVAFKGTAFDYQAFGFGLGGVLAAGGLGISLKSHTEPGQ